MSEAKVQIGRAMDPVVIVSADGHCGALPETYRQYIEPRFRHEIDRLVREDQARNEQVASFLAIPDKTLAVIDERSAIRTGGVTGAWDVVRRLKELDAEGVVAEVLFPNQQCALMPFFSVTNRPNPPELRAAGARAYHRWLAEVMSASDGRLIGVADPGLCVDMDETVRDLEWLASVGFRSVTLPGALIGDPAVPPLWDAYYEPFWTACTEFGLVLSVHAGHGHAQGEMSKSMDQMADVRLTRVDVMTRMHDGSNGLHGQNDLGPRRPFWELMLGGVFDRFPTLKLALTEIHADWVPATLSHLDERFERDPMHLKLSKRPSDFWAEHCYVSISSPLRVEVDIRKEIGCGRMMFGMDYPQPESTWPNTKDWIRVVFEGVAEDEARAILGGNAIECYGLSEVALRALAERIGPQPHDILGQHLVDSQLIADFSLRAGYDRAGEIVDTDLLDQDINTALAQL